MIIKRTIVDQIEVGRTGIIQVRFRKEVVEDSDVLAFGYHRTSFVPGASFDDQMTFVNDNLVSLGNKPVENTEVLRIKAITNIVHTPQAIEAYSVLLSAQPTFM